MDLWTAQKSLLRHVILFACFILGMACAMAIVLSAHFVDMLMSRSWDCRYANVSDPILLCCYFCNLLNSCSACFDSWCSWISASTNRTIHFIDVDRPCSSSSNSIYVSLFLFSEFTLFCISLLFELYLSTDLNCLHPEEDYDNLIQLVLVIHLSTRKTCGKIWEQCAELC
jgi:hypothetical protein